ncbi:hypothetical protein M3212_08205 [Alkalihalobacillus oceani]|uniref:hypothetical protein n=1 Tax=Halalkalibacter oceani TaxID=1653776 RepID=UPI00203B3610|nr:hypothetical protein [Halalkalibacter oceani]MCM3760769.1 hypothetical protein [Halalkalibacter oceani]
MTKQKWIIVMILLIGLTGYTLWNEEQAEKTVAPQEEESEQEKPLETESEAEEFFNPLSVQIPEATYEEWDQLKRSRTRGLTRARELENTITPEIEISFKEGGNESLIIEEIWYTPDQVHVFYSVDLPEEIHEYYNLPVLSGRMRIGGEGDLESNGSYSNQWMTDEARMVEGRYHDRLIFDPVRDENGEVIRQISELHLFDLTLHKGGKSYELNEVSIPMELDFDQVKTISIPIEQAFSADGNSLYMEELRITPFGMELLFQEDSEDGDPLLDLSVDLISGDEISVGFFYQGMFRDHEQKFIQFEPVDELPQELELKIQSATYVSDQGVSFAIPLIRDSLLISIDRSQDEIYEESIGTLFGAELVFQEATYSQNTLEWKLLVKAKENGSRSLAIPYFTEASFYERTGFEFGRPPLYLTYKTGDQPVNNLHTIGMSGNIDEHGQYIAVELSGIRQLEADELIVQIENVTYTQHFPDSLSVSFSPDGI